MKVNKYTYYRVIQQQYGQGWEDADQYETTSSYTLDKEGRKTLKHDLENYKLLGYPTRTINRKELNK